MKFGENQELTAEELKQIRSLQDWDLTMLISDIHDHGWPKARMTLQMMMEARAKGRLE